mmetsp:Transcript_8250/g.13813  ORF Transcript_8250/g.13813 Transcript_8250/m.13813 type:complete len:98 (+) Transcript_8250:87-380(+)
MVLQVDGESNEVVGEVLRKKMRKENLWHRASYVFVVNSKGQFVVQQRSMIKEYLPGGYALATGGVVGSGETNEFNAQKELEEELGVERKLEEMQLLG